MKDMLQRKAENYTREHKKKKLWQRVVSGLAAVAVFCTTYAMILPAITWERSLVCEIPEHRHDESCYEMKIVPGEKELVCLETEHEHGPECYIITDNLICGLEECEGHTHGEGCFDETGALICTLEESEGHSHSEACYEKELVCQIPEHTHSDGCYVESEPHEEMVLVCQLEEHEHSAACFDAPPAEDDGYYCGQIEHVHSEKQYCYFSDGSLWCTIPEHVHTLACKSNPNADVENEAKWCSTFADVSLTGNWAEDVIAIAKTQLGYTESTLNYKVQEDGTTIKGYTRYGDWYGDPYGDWCAMFCSFCLHYAGVDENLMPLASRCEAWVSSLTEKELYHEPDNEYEPKSGDLVFFNNVDDPYADHVGFVFEVHEDGLTTIEGNWGDCVCTVERRFADGQITGYGELPEIPAMTVDVLQPETIETEITIESEPASDGAVAVISGYLPAEATAKIEMVHLSESELIEYFGAAKAKAMSVYATYDITIMLNGEEWQPDESVSVTIRKPASNDGGIGQTAVEHIDSVTGEAERINTSSSDDSTISFIADGFSVYVFYTFTVDYYFGEAEYHQPGLSSMYLSKLLMELGIDHSIMEIDDVTFSNSNLLNVRKDSTGDWQLCSLEAFSSDETLTLTLKDGEEIRIDTKDVAYTWFNVHNVVTGGNVGDKYYFTFDYYDENGAHQQYDRWLANYETINALKVALNTPVTITQIQGKYMDAGGTIHTDGVYDNYLQLGGDPQVRTNVFHVDNMTTVFQNVNVCFYEISSNGLGILNITKNAVNSSDPNQTYHFVVLYHATNYKMNAAEFDLKSGETKNILYYCDTIYGNNMEIFIAETSAFPNCEVSFTVNGGTAQIPQQETLYGRIHEDIGYQFDGYKFIKFLISGNYDTFNVVCNNTFVDRSVTIRKTAVQGEPNKSYTFTLKAYNASNQLVWQGSASVKSGNSSKVTIPVDCSYVIVQETNHAGYTVSMSGSGSNSGTDGRRIPKAQFPANVTFTNTREVVPITLTKKLVCDDMAGAGPFNFEVSVTNASGNPIDVSTITQPTGSGITLKPGTSNVLQVSIGGFSSSVTEKSVQINVPKGAKITITEANPGSGYNVTNSLGGTNTAVINSAANGSPVKFTNTEAPSTVSMTVIKHLAGLQNGEFDFEMSVDSPSWPPSVTPADWPSGAVIGTDGVIRFSLTVTNGNVPQITIPGIPAGSEVTITEISHDGFNVKFTDSASAYVHVGYTDTYELTENKTVTVVNTAGAELPSTGGVGVYPIYALGALLVAGPIVYGCILRRRRERRTKE